MKVILSRKGFDGQAGHGPSFIMPDGSLLSMPIPSGEDEISYSDIAWNGVTYADLLKQVYPKEKYNKCHLDPDIRDNRKQNIRNWRPAFGQTGKAQGYLENAGVEPGDIFLFFGWFRKLDYSEGVYSFCDEGDFYSTSNLQVIYGYLQVAEVIKDYERVNREFPWHPHSNKRYFNDKNNALYIPTESLSIKPSMKGYGTLDYRKDRVLTMEGQTRAIWNEYDFLMPDNICGNRKNAREKGIYYAGQWQELVINETDSLMEWVKRIIE